MMSYLSYLLLFLSIVCGVIAALLEGQAAYAFFTVALIVYTTVTHMGIRASHSTVIACQPRRGSLRPPE